MADLLVEDHGSIALVRPVSDRGRTWLAENTETEGWQWLGEALAVEPRYVVDLLNGAVKDGLKVRPA